MTRSFKENDTLLIFASALSLRENFRYNIYYDQIQKNNNQAFRYVGIYANKKVVGIGEIEKIICCDYIDGELISTNNTGLNLSRDESERIKAIIEKTGYYEIKTNHKFYLVDNFNKTDFAKVSPGPMRAKKYISLNNYDGYKQDMNADEIATLLYGRTWN